MSIEESYEWAKKQRAAWDNQVGQDKYLNALDREISFGGDHQFETIQFSKVACEHFVGEVGVVEGDLIFHFFPAGDAFGDNFSDGLAQAFLDVFKLEDRLCWDFVPEMNSWVVRASGFGSNPQHQVLAGKLFVALECILGE